MPFGTVHYPWKGDLNHTSLNVMRQATFLVFHQIMPWLISMFFILELHAGGSGVRIFNGLDLKLFLLVGWDRSFFSVAWPTGVQLVFFRLLAIFSDVVWRQGLSIVGQLNVSVNPRFLLIVIYLFVLDDDHPLHSSPGGPNN